MKWKIPAIILAVVLIMGVAVKFAVDKLFSYIVLSTISGSELNLDSLLTDTNSSAGLPENGYDYSNTGSANEDVKNTDANGKESENNAENGGIAPSDDDKNIIVSKENNTDNMNSNNIKGVDQSQSIKQSEGKDTAKNEIGASSDSISDTGLNSSGNDAAKDSANNDKKDNDKKDSEIKDTEHSNTGPESKAGIEDTKDKKDTIDRSGDENPGGSASDVNGRNKDSNNKTDNKSTKDNTNNTSSNPDSIEVTSDKIKEAEKQVSTVDKLKATQILLSKLRPSDIAILKDMLFGGNLTEDEISRAKQIIKERVTEDEKEVLKSLYNKYGDLLDD